METDSKDKITSVEQLIAWADTRCHGHLAYTSTDLMISGAVWSAYTSGEGGVFLLNEPLSSGIRGARKAAVDVSRPNGWNYQIVRNSHLWWFYREMLRHYVGDRILPGNMVPSMNTRLVTRFINGTHFSGSFFANIWTWYQHPIQ